MQGHREVGGDHEGIGRAAEMELGAAAVGRGLQQELPRRELRVAVARLDQVDLHRQRRRCSGRHYGFDAAGDPAGEIAQRQGAADAEMAAEPLGRVGVEIAGQRQGGEPAGHGHRQGDVGNRELWRHPQAALAVAAPLEPAIEAAERQLAVAEARDDVTPAGFDSPHPEIEQLHRVVLDDQPVDGDLVGIAEMEVGDDRAVPADGVHGKPRLRQARGDQPLAQDHGRDARHRLPGRHQQDGDHQQRDEGSAPASPQRRRWRFAEVFGRCHGRRSLEQGGEKANGGTPRPGAENRRPRRIPAALPPGGRAAEGSRATRRRPRGGPSR